MNARRLILAVPFTIAALLIFFGGQALAITGNAYKSRFTGSDSERGSFYPESLAINAGGDVFVSSFFTGTVDEYNASGSGKPIHEFKDNEVPSGTLGESKIAISASGDIYIASREAVNEFDPAGKFISEFTGSKTAAGSFLLNAIAVSPSGDVYAADYAHNVVDEFNSTGSGKPIAELTGTNTAGGSFIPQSLAVDASGDVYVGDADHQVVDEFAPSGGLVREFSGAKTPQGTFSEVNGVAVAPSGEVYIVDSGAELIDRFSSTGIYLSQFDGGATPNGFFELGSIAINASGEVYVGEQNQNVLQSFVDIYSKAEPVPDLVTGMASELHSASAKLSGSIDPSGGPEATCEFKYGTTPAYGSTVPCEPAGPFSGLSGVSAEISNLQPETEYFYRLEGITDNGLTVGENGTFKTPATQPPTVGIAPVAAIAKNSATFEGEVDPHESETSYSFEDSTDGVSWTSLGELNSDNGEVPVKQTVDDLVGNTTYYVRLVAINFAGETATSTEEKFTTLAASPLVFDATATDVTATEAKLQATVRPENKPTTYSFEYGATAAYGTTIPIGQSKTGSAPTQVTQTITGLTSLTTYHFRITASNGIGAPTSTPDQTFTTLSDSETLAAGCPNEQVRAESAIDPETERPFSMQLPECRAYELVSPPLKNGGPFSSESFQAIGAGSIASRIGIEGSTVLVQSTGIWPHGTEQTPNDDLLTTIAAESVRYKLTRGESGWDFKAEVPSASDLSLYEPFVVPSDTNLSVNGIWRGFGFAPNEYGGSGDLREKGNLYLLESDNALAEIGPTVPPEEGGISTEGGEDHPCCASANLSRVLFSPSQSRWPFDQTQRSAQPYTISSLYEYIGTGHTGTGSDVPALVGVDNHGALISQCGTDGEGISSGGSTVFFSSQAAGEECKAHSQAGESGTGPIAKQLFARIGEPGKGVEVGRAVTVNVAATSDCAGGAFDSCNVTKPVKYQGSSADGSKVFFTSEQSLTGGEDSTNNLYECELSGDSGTPPARSGNVNSCPDLMRVSVPISGVGANVLSVPAVSADGSHAYFIAQGVLTGENPERNSPAPGQDNLYEWQGPSSAYPQGHTAFIATLSTPTLGEREGQGDQVTPSGNSFVFTSAADLTPDDTSTVSQVFLYEASRETLIRISQGEDGFNGDGNTDASPASIASGTHRTISDDGSMVVFESEDALASQVHGETLHNVYLWHNGNVSLISDGTPAGEAVPPGHSGHSAGLVGIDASGQNVFFVTETHLVGQDVDELPDLYDARIGGGFPAPEVPGCSGEACQGALPVPLSPLSPGSLSAGAVGNLTPLGKAPPTLKPKSLTRAQKLAKALKACEKDRSRQRRARCEMQAQRHYGAKAKSKPRSKHEVRKSSGKEGK